MNITFVNWVTVSRYAELSGLSVSSVENRIQHYWVKGLQYRWDGAGRQIGHANSQMFFKVYSKWLDSDDDWKEVEKLNKEAA